MSHPHGSRSGHAAFMPGTTETSEQVIAKNVGELEWTTISQNRLIETRCNGPLDGGSIANQARHSPTITCLLW